MKRVILRPALADIREIVSFIRLDRPRTAIQWRSELYSRLDVLRTWPLAGRIVPEFENPAIREIIVGNYRAMYRLSTERVEVFLIIDARRDLTSVIREPEAEYTANAERCL